MDISKAVEELKKKEGTTLNCSTEQTVTSLKKEEFWFVLVQTKYEDGATDKMELRMERFERLYAPQQFSKSGPAA